MGLQHKERLADAQIVLLLLGVQPELREALGFERLLNRRLSLLDAGNRLHNAESDVLLGATQIVEVLLLGDALVCEVRRSLPIAKGKIERDADAVGREIKTAELIERIAKAAGNHVADVPVGIADEGVAA